MRSRGRRALKFHITSSPFATSRSTTAELIELALKDPSVIEQRARIAGDGKGVRGVPLNVVLAEQADQGRDGGDGAARLPADPAPIAVFKLPKRGGRSVAAEGLTANPRVPLDDKRRAEQRAARSHRGRWREAEAAAEALTRKRRQPPSK